MLRPRAAVLLEECAEAHVPELLLPVVTAFGFDADVHTCPRGQIEGRTASLAREVPVLLLIPDPVREVLSIEAETIETNYVVVVVREGSPVAQCASELAQAVLVCEESGGSRFVLDVVQAMATASAELRAHPGRYVPLAKRTTEAREPYRVLHMSKEAIISPTGHGLVDFSYELRIEGDGFSGTSHFFGLTDEAGADASLPPITQLMNRPAIDRFLGQSFSYRLLSPNDGAMRMNAVEVLEESTRRRKVLRFLFSPQPHVGQVIKYAMSWSHPGLYAVHGLDTSALKCPHDFEHIDISHLFLSDRTEPATVFERDGEPTLHVYNPLDMHIAQLTSTRTTTIRGLRYSWSLSGLVSHSTAVAEWNRR